MGVKGAEWQKATKAKKTIADFIFWELGELVYCFAVNTNVKPLKRIRIRESFGETVNISQRC